MSNIQQFFDQKSVFVTGATGFLGKVLIEKLLRSCEGIRDVFVLIRTKKNESPEQRFKKYIDDCAFKTLREKHFDRLSKLKIISGDMSSHKLGISDDDELTLIESVDVVFHCAAIIRFDFSLMDIMKVNVKGTHRALELAEKMRQLKAFVFVSTAFSQSYQFDMEERHYSSGYNPVDLVNFVEKNNSEAIAKVETALFGKKHPSTYTMSKAIAEDLAYSYKGKIPIAIVRPSIIIPAQSEPEEGFIQGIQGATGIGAGLMTGLIRNLWGGDKVNTQTIPVDYVSNATIAVAYQRAMKTDNSSCLFFNCASSSSNFITWGEMDQRFYKIMEPFVPYEKMLWYPSWYRSSNKAVFMFRSFFTQIIPALLFDLFLTLSGRKRFMYKLQKLIYNAAIGFAHFTNNNFTIEIDNMQKLYSDLGEDDKKAFMFDVEQIDWWHVTALGSRGVRKLVFLDGEETIPKAQAKLKRLYYIHNLMKLVLCASFVYFVFF